MPHRRGFVWIVSFRVALKPIEWITWRLLVGLIPLGFKASSFSSLGAARSYRKIMGDPDLEG